MSKAMLQRAIEVREVIKLNPANYSTGLCELLLARNECDSDQKRLRYLFTLWPENVHGSAGFPVPAPIGYTDPRVYGFAPHIAAYDNLPKYTGEYGASRMRLLDFIISELEKVCE